MFERGNIFVQQMYFKCVLCQPLTQVCNMSMIKTDAKLPTFWTAFCWELREVCCGVNTVWPVMGRHSELGASMLQKYSLSQPSKSKFSGTFSQNGTESLSANMYLWHENIMFIMSGVSYEWCSRQATRLKSDVVTDNTIWDNFTSPSCCADTVWAHGTRLTL